MMRHKIFIFLLLFIFLLPMSWAGVTADIAKIDAKIDEAMSHFFGPATPGADSKKGFICLIDALEMATPHTGFGEDFLDKIKEANTLFKSTSIFNEDGIAFLQGGYKAINSGKDFEMPKEISSIEDARDYARKQVVTAKKYLKESDFDESVKLLLEVAVLIVTPMEKKR
jgi:hypothetical protein